MLTGFDVARFVELIQTLEVHPFEPARGLFEAGREIVIARAPGRLDVMGGIADYSGALVLQWPIREATFAAVQPHPARVLRIVSLSDAGASRVLRCAARRDSRPRACRCPTTRHAPGLPPTRPALGGVRRRRLAGSGTRAGLPLTAGARVLVQSAVPEGKGRQFVGGARGGGDVARWPDPPVCDMPPRDTALLCQQVENLVVGAPCGVMDQMAAISGEAGTPDGAALPAGRVRGHGAHPRISSRCGASIPAFAMQ